MLERCLLSESGLDMDILLEVPVSGGTFYEVFFSGRLRRSLSSYFFVVFDDSLN